MAKQAQWTTIRTKRTARTGERLFLLTDLGSKAPLCQLTVLGGSLAATVARVKQQYTTMYASYGYTILE